MLSRHDFFFFIFFFYFLILVDVNRASISLVIDLMDPTLKKLTTINKEYRMINNLIDLDIQDDDELKSLGNQYADILSQKEKIIESHNNTSHVLDRLIGIIAGIYFDYNKLRGIDVRQYSPKISNLVKNYNNEQLVNFILDDGSDYNEA